MNTYWHSTLRECALSWAGARYREISARYREPAHDITTRVRYRAAIMLSCVCAISSPARDIAGPRGNIVGFPTISRPGRGIVPTRVIVSARRDRVAYRGTATGGGARYIRALRSAAYYDIANRTTRIAESRDIATPCRIPYSLVRCQSVDHQNISYLLPYRVCCTVS